MTVTLSVLAGCSSADEDPASAPQPLDAEQAQLLASVRFENYRAGTGEFSTNVPIDGQEFMVHGVVDWKEHVGSAVVETPSGADLLQWSFSHVAYHVGGGADGLPPAPPSDGSWRFRSLDPAASSLDTVLALLLNLGADRPENAQLLQAGDARHVETTSLNGVEVDVFSGPTESDGSAVAPAESSDGQDSDRESSTRFWVDTDGQLRRFEVRLGSSRTFVTIDLDVSRQPELEMIPNFPKPESGAGS